MDEMVIFQECDAIHIRPDDWYDEPIDAFIAMTIDQAAKLGADLPHCLLNPENNVEDGSLWCSTPDGR